MCWIPTRWRRLPAAASPEPLRPSEEDELAHAATAEPLWSESWYADFADTAQGLGGWFRLGLVANQQTAWVHALLCGPDLPTVAVVDCEVPLPVGPVGAAHRRVRTRPLRERAAADLPCRPAGAGSGLLGPVGLAAWRAGNAGRHDDEFGVGHRRHALQVSADDALRDPVHRLGHGHRRRHQLPSEFRSRATRSLVGRARLVGHGLDVERGAPRRRHPPARREHPDSGRSRRQRRLRPGSRRQGHRAGNGGQPEKRSATTGYR